MARAVITPSIYTKAIHAAANNLIQRIIKEESEKAAEAVKKRVIEECFGLTAQVYESMGRDYNFRPEINLVLNIPDAGQKK